MTLGGCAALAAGVLVFADFETEGPAPAALRQSAAPNYSQPAEPRLRLAQQYGTVCQTPQGAVCTVAPAPMNSRCDCGGTFGLIVR